jgi:hypothetical protein
MAAALFSKKDPHVAVPPETTGDGNAGELEQLTGQLGQLGELLAQAKGQIADYLARRQSQSPAGGTDPQIVADLSRQIAQLAEKIDRLAAAGPSTEAAAPAASDEPGLKAMIEPLGKKLDRVEARVKALSERSAAASADDGPANAVILQAVGKLQKQLDSGLRRLVELLAPPEQPAEEEPPLTSAQWEQAILGPSLAQNPALAFHRQQMLTGVLAGDAGACALAGQLLVFQSSPPERLPQLLKDLGEAFYRWQPKNTPGTNPMEEALVAWLRRSCENAGINNTIELVHAGERFDSTRHNATSRGVEITEVRGWIVLRDNGRVYTKATVAVR